MTTRTLSDRAIRKVAHDLVGGPIGDIHLHREGGMVYVLVPGRRLVAQLLDDGDFTAADLRAMLHFRRLKA